MLIKEKLGNISSFDVTDRRIDLLSIDWFEANKRIMHKHTQSGEPITLKFLQQNPALSDGDVLYMDDKTVVAVEIKACEAIVIKPATIMEASSMCYEIGNKHLPLFYEGDELLIPYDAPLYRLLTASGYTMIVEQRKLVNAIKTSVLPHAHSGSNTGLFTKILQLTSS